MEDGSYTLWNPAEMIATYSSRNPPSINNIEQQAALVYAEELE